MNEEERAYLIGEYGMEDWPTQSVLEFGYNKGVEDTLKKIQKEKDD